MIHKSIRAFDQNEDYFCKCVCTTVFVCNALCAGRWLAQAGILTGLKHGHLVEMRGFYKWDKAYCLALEHMAGGELCDDIIRRVNYCEADARNVSSFYNVQ